MAATEPRLSRGSIALALSVPSVAKLLDVHPRTAYRLVASGAIKSITVGCRKRVLRSELDRYLAGRAAAEVSEQDRVANAMSAFRRRAVAS
jgi:excisionase family DNA binding protein